VMKYVWIVQNTNSAVKDSSGSSASSPIRMIPLLRSASTLHMAWIVLPKWRPWWTRGSVTLLQKRLSTHRIAGVKERHTLSFLGLIAARLPGGVYLREEPRDPRERSRRQSEAWLHWCDIRLFESTTWGERSGKPCREALRDAFY
jgi:hypothetical protein